MLGKVHFKEAVRLYMYVYLVLSDCAQKLPSFRKEGGVGKAVDEVLKPPFTPVVSNLSMGFNMVIIFLNLCRDELNVNSAHVNMN